MKKIFSILIAFMCIMTMSAQNSTPKSKSSAKETSTLKFVHAGFGATAFAGSDFENDFRNLF
ncbi:MAG: hypothetical protein J6032_06000 [Bacteroidales bacterium]|nr:hypothetical protein [Bacteroidales bacterium]